jgi:DNA-binding CsgD family transcriptional regulator
MSFVAFFATLPLYSPNMVFSSALPGFETTMPFFANTALACAMIAGAGVVIAVLRRSSLVQLRMTALSLVSLSYLIGYLLLFYSFLYSPAHASMLGFIGGALCGLGSVFLTIAWAYLFSFYGLRDALLRLGILFALSATINTALMFVVPRTLLAIFLVLIVLGFVSPLARGSHKRVYADTEVSRDSMQARGSDPSSNETRDPPATQEAFVSVFRRLFSVIVGPFIGFLLFALTMAVRKVQVFDLVYAESLGAVSAAFIVAPLCFWRSEKPLLPFIYQVFLPCIVGLLILLNSFPADSPAQAIGAPGIYVFFGIIGLLALASFTAAANAQEFPVALIFGLGLSSFAAISLIGLHFSKLPLVGDYFEEILPVLSTLYFIYLVLSPGVKAWHSMFIPAKDETSSAPGENLEGRCEQLSLSCGLSPRESEIMLFIGRGYSPAFIAKKLFLSDSTVRSHVKNIYRKLNVNSREDLLQLIDSHQ